MHQLIVFLESFAEENDWGINKDFIWYNTTYQVGTFTPIFTIYPDSFKLFRDLIALEQCTDTGFLKLTNYIVEIIKERYPVKLDVEIKFYYHLRYTQLIQI